MKKDFSPMRGARQIEPVGIVFSVNCNYISYIKERNSPGARRAQRKNEGSCGQVLMINNLSCNTGTITILNTHRLREQTPTNVNQ